MFLPNIGVFGGVRRFIELGNAWTASGHDVTLHHPAGDSPEWLPFRGRTMRLDAAASAEAVLAVCADPHTFEAFRAHRARVHLYYCVIERDRGLPRAIADRELLLAANSGALRASISRGAGRPVLDGAGGINLDQFRPDPSKRSSTILRILLNGRRSRPKKGTDLILRALRGLESSGSGRKRGSAPAFEVVLFDSVDPARDPDPRDGAPLPSGARYVLNPTQDELVALYQSADVFVAAERKAGWCNTAIEAMACGAAVVCTKSGTRDFARHEANALVVPMRHPFFLRRAIRRVLGDGALRERLGASARESLAPWSWPRLAAKLLEQVEAATTVPARSAAPARADRAPGRPTTV